MSRWKDHLNRVSQKLKAAFSRATESLRGPLRSVWIPERFKNAAQIRESLQLWIRKARAVEWRNWKNWRHQLTFDVKTLAKVGESVQSFLEKRKIEDYAPVLSLVISTYFVADLTAILIEEMIPDPPVVRRTLQAEGHRTSQLGDYDSIFVRNLFNSKGLIWGEDGSRVAGPSIDPHAAPIKTQLPLDLVGTVILKDSRRSLAALSDKSASKLYPVRFGDEIPGLLKVESVEPNRVVFINLKTQRREYVEIPEDPRMAQLARPSGGSVVVTPGGVEKISQNQIRVSRKKVDETLKDLNRVLTQARAVPHFENGSPAGYKLFQIVPGSIYEQLGFKNNDVIAGINGDPVADPSKAFEMLNELRTTSHVEITVKRNGVEQVLAIDIN